MKDTTIIAIVLAIGVLVMQIIAFMLGIDGQVLIITSNVFIGLLTYYFGYEKNKFASYQEDD